MAEKKAMFENYFPLQAGSAATASPDKINEIRYSLYAHWGPPYGGIITGAFGCHHHAFIVF